jgi:hypothetical protein
LIAITVYGSYGTDDEESVDEENFATAFVDPKCVACIETLDEEDTGYYQVTLSNSNMIFYTDVDGAKALLQARGIKFNLNKRRP